MRSENPDLAGNQLNDRDDSSSLPGLLAEVGVRGVDAVGELPKSLPLGCVLDDFGPKWLSAENNVRMLEEVVVPGWVTRPAPKRRDDRDSIAVVEVERRIPTRPARPRAARLEQVRRDGPRGAEPTVRELEQMRVDLPGDVHRKPTAHLAGGETADGEI